MKSDLHKNFSEWKYWPPKLIEIVCGHARARACARKHARNFGHINNVFFLDILMPFLTENEGTLPTGNFEPAILGFMNFSVSCILWPPGGQ